MPYILRAAAALVLVVAGCGSVASPPDAPSRAVSCGPQPIQVLPNGGFDDASPPWTQQPVTPPLLCDKTAIPPVDGTALACLGAVDGTVRTLSQQLPLPVGARTAKLSGQICIATNETVTADRDILAFDVVDGDNVIAALGTATNQMGAKTCDYSAFERTATLTSDPATATLRLRSTLDASNTTTFFVDALSLTISCAQ